MAEDNEDDAEHNDHDELFLYLTDMTGEWFIIPMLRSDISARQHREKMIIKQPGIPINLQKLLIFL